MILVEDPDKAPRSYIIYTNLNHITKAEFFIFLLPNIKERVEKVGAAMYISTVPCM